MTRKELREIALRLVSKGYSWEEIRYSDDLYDATPQEIDECRGYVKEVESEGTANFIVEE